MSPKFGFKGPKGQGKVGKFQQKPGKGPQKKVKIIEKKAEDEFDFSDNSEYSDEGIGERTMGKKSAQKRSLTFAKDVNTSSAKKTSAKKTPIPSKGVKVADLDTTPVGKSKINKKGKKIQQPSDDEDSEDFDSEMDASDFDEDGSLDGMGSEEEEDSLMGIDEDSEDDDDDDDGDSDEAPQLVEVPNKKAGIQLKFCGIPKVATAKLQSFLTSKGFKGVELDFDQMARCFVGTVKSQDVANKMKSELKGSNFMKHKLSVLDFKTIKSADSKKNVKKADDNKLKSKVNAMADISEEDWSDGDEEDELAEDDFDDEELSDEELSGEDEGELESFDEDDMDGDEDNTKILKKAIQTTKDKAKELKSKTKVEEKAVGKKSSKTVETSSLPDNELKVVIKGVAKSYDVAKVKSFLQGKGVNVKGDVAWEGQHGGFVVAVASRSDIDKVQALRGSKLQKFNLAVKVLDAVAAAAALNISKTETAKKQTESKRNIQEEIASSVVLKGIPKSLDIKQLEAFLKSKNIATTKRCEYNQEAGGFLVTLKSKKDLEMLKKVKSEKVGGKYRFSVNDYTPKISHETVVAENVINDVDEDGDDDGEGSDISGSDDGDSVKDEDVSDEESDEESDEDHKGKEEPSAKVQKTEKPNQSPQKGGAVEFSFRLMGIPKASPTNKLEEFFKSRGFSTVSIKLANNHLIAKTTTSQEGDKLLAMSGIRYNNFLMKIEKNSTDASNKEEKSVPASQLQFRARLVSIPSDFAVSKLSNMIKTRGVKSIVVTKENGQYVANCQSKEDFNKLMSLKGQKIDNQIRLMIATIGADKKPKDQKQQPESRKRQAEEALVGKENNGEVKKVRQNFEPRLQLFVRNISCSASDEDIRQCFPECTSVKIIRRPQAKSYFGFVTFDSESTCELVKKTKESSGPVKLRGKDLFIDYCGDKSSKFQGVKSANVSKETSKKIEKEAESKDDSKADSKAETPKSKLKTAQSPSKDAHVRFADDVKDNEPVDEEDDDDNESFDEDDSDFDDEDAEMVSIDDDDDDDDEEDEDEDDD